MLLNETTPLDMSNSEFWSSFSSSEEALLECEGLILNLPLTPHRQCHAEASEGDSFAAAKANALTYRWGFKIGFDDDLSLSGADTGVHLGGRISFSRKLVLNKRKFNVLFVIHIGNTYIFYQ